MTEEEREQIKNELYDYINRNCIFRCDPDKRYSESAPIGKLASNNPSSFLSYQFYMRRLTHNAKMLHYVSALIFDHIMKSMNNGTEYPAVQLCGMETSSIPIMIGIQQYAGRFGISINSFSIRKTRKSYGLFNFVDGIPTDVPVIVVDDVVNSASSIAKVLDLCKYELNLKPANNMYGIVSIKQDIKSYRSYGESAFYVNTLFKADQFNTKFIPELYWLPDDCDRSYNKRPDYK